MALMTVAFCEHCKWRSSAQPLKQVAGAPCPQCRSCVSTIHYDPTYIGTDILGRKYVEADALNAHLTAHGVSTMSPVGVALPTQSVLSDTTVVN